MERTVHGYCPTQDKMYSLRVSYYPDTTATEDTQTRYRISRPDCEFTKSGGRCTTPTCPIIKQLL